MAFKMKGNPYKMGKMATKSAYKNTGDPKKEMTKEEIDAAIANAMPAAEKKIVSKETIEEAKRLNLFGDDGQISKDKVRQAHKKVGSWIEDDEHQNIDRVAKAFE